MDCVFVPNWGHLINSAQFHERNKKHSTLSLKIVKSNGCEYFWIEPSGRLDRDYSIFMTQGNVLQFLHFSIEGLIKIKKWRKRTRFKEKKEVKGKALHFFDNNMGVRRYTICILAELSNRLVRWRWACQLSLANSWTGAGGCYVARNIVLLNGWGTRIRTLIDGVLMFLFLWWSNLYCTNSVNQRIYW